MTPESIRTIQNLSIEPEEILYLVQEMTRRRETSNEVDWYTSLAILFDRYPCDGDRTFCINQRMECLLPMMADARMRGWSMDAVEPGCVLTNESVFRAVAKCPLHAGEDRLWFDPDEFFRLVLEESQPQGRA